MPIATLNASMLKILENGTCRERKTGSISSEVDKNTASNVPKAMALVFGFYCVFTPLSTLLGNYLAEGLHWNEYLVTAINMIANFVLEFLYDRFVVFRDSLDTNSVAKKKENRE